MTAANISGLHGTGKPRKELLLDKNRVVTDKLALIVFLTFLILWISSWTYAIYISHDSDTLSLYNSSYVANTSTENNTYIKSTSDAVDDLLLSINSTIHMFSSNPLISELYFWHFTKCLSISLVFYSLTQFVFSSTETIFRKDHVETVAHYLIVNTGKFIFKLIISTGYISIYSHLYGWPWEQVSLSLKILLILEFYPYGNCIAAVSILTDSSAKKNIFKRVLRFYTNCRNLILFRLLILTIVLLLMASNIVVSKSLGRENVLSLLVMIAGSIHMIFFLNNYGNMVIIAATAFHAWSGSKSAIPFKKLLSTAITIGTYHFGTIFLHTLCIRRTYSLRKKRRLPELDAMLRHFGNHTDIVSHVIERSAILTAVHSQNFEQATTNILWIEMEEPVKFKSLTSIVWKNISYSSCTLAIWISSYPIPNVESLWLRVMTIGISLALQGIYHYIITMMDTIDYTIEFCKKKNERNIVTLDDKKQSEATTVNTMV